MRPIKFRMWNPCGNHYHYGECVMECLKQQVCGVYNHEKEYGAVFEQFTGLVDKNGKEIYEGDILGDPISLIVHWCKNANGWQLKYLDDGKCACYRCEGDCELSDWDVGDCEVIGNIHENPDLLEAK